MAQPLYSTSLNISSFMGLNQSGDGYNMDMRFAREMENVDVSGGSFKPMREGRRLEQTLHEPIGTLAYLHRRWGENTGTLLIAISNGRVWAKTLDGNDEWEQRYPAKTTSTTTEEADPEAEEGTVTTVTHDSEGRETVTTVTTQDGTVTTTVIAEVEAPLAVIDCDWVTYEISIYPEYDGEKTYGIGERCTIYDAETGLPTSYICAADIDEPEADFDSKNWTEITNTDPVDILLFSNATDGMYCLYGDTLDVVPVQTPKKFGVLARYNERIWGAGIIDDPDMLVYSTPYDPFNWAQNDEIPEDGAGDIQQPTWDGDSFVSLKQYGNTLLAIKRNSIWRISGTNPGEFIMQQQYGGGTIDENTVAVYNDIAYMMGEYGILRYDGSGAYPFQQEAVQNLMRDDLSRIYNPPEYSDNRSYYPGEMCTHTGKAYRCIVPIRTTAQSDRTIDGEEWTPEHWEEVHGTPMDLICAGMWNGVYCLALPTHGSWYCNTILQYSTLTRTFSLRTGVSVSSFLQINERLFFTSATYPGAVFELDDTKGRVLPVKWVSGYQDLGQKNSIKSAFIVYMMVDSETPVDLWAGIRTEKKLKRKRITTKPGKVTRKQLNCQGREFRLEIETHDATPYTIAGGIRVDLELDPD